MLSSVTSYVFTKILSKSGDFIMLMKGKKGVVLGVANQRSIAWGITQSLLKQGADVALTCLNDRNRRSVEKLLVDYPEVPVYECDVTKPETIEATFASLKEKYGEIDFMIHCLAFADKADLDGGFINKRSKCRFPEVLVDSISQLQVINLQY